MENNEKAYYEKVDIDNELKLRKQLAALPPYCKQYFIAIESKTQSRTRLAYAYDLSCFFDYLHENNPVCKKMSITEIPLSILESLKPMDLEEYLYNLKVYEKDGMAHTNEERGIKRKLSSLRSFYKYLYKNEFIQSNPASKVSTPKIHEKNIIRLDADEVANLLDEVESGENLTKKQQMFHDRTKVRDLALLTLMLGTGIRVSECVGLDLDDVDLKNNGIKIHRKGGAEVVVYFGEEVRNALWKNAKSGDLDRLHDAWSEVLTQIDKGKKARVAAASKVRQILEECAAVDTSGRYDNAENWYQC